jgi:hypothetical protein
VLRVRIECYSHELGSRVRIERQGRVLRGFECFGSSVAG